MRITVVGVGAAIAVLLVSAAASSAPRQKPLPPESTAPVKADLDGDGIFDDLEARLAGLPQEGRIDVIVTLRLPATSERLSALKGRFGAFDVQRVFSVVKGFSAKLTRGQVEALARFSDVIHVEENSPVRALNNSAQQSFGVTKARLDANVDGDGDGNAAAYSPADLVAAVIDTGIDPNHLDLDDGKILAFHDLVGGRSTPYDDNGHGTHVAATIAGDGEARSDRLYKGVAPAAGLVGVKVLNGQGSGTMADVTAGIEWVVANKDTYGVEAINLSLGASGCSNGTDATSQAVNRAHAAGIVVVVAVGNEGPGTCTVGSPGAAADALTVGAMADMGVKGFKQAYFSSRGPTADGRIKPDVSAAGVTVTSARAGTTTGYVDYSGTSMATPFVAGVALLMRDVDASLTPQQVKDKITQTAIDWARGGDNRTAGSGGADIDYGAGRVDAYAAIRAAGAAISSAPDTPTHELREGTLSGTGAFVDYQLEITDTRFPIAATLIIPSISGSGAFSPDFDLYVFNPSGQQVAAAETARRQDELGYQPPSTGTYKLRVRSYSGSGQYFVDVSAGLGTPPPDASAPNAPTGLTATAGDAQVSLDWTDNTESDIGGYKVYRRNADGTWPSTALATTTASAYTDTGLANGTTYTYRVTAYDTSGNESAPSSEASATPAKAPVTKQYQPGGYGIVKGTVYSGRGDVSRLYSNDGNRLEISAVKNGSYLSEIDVYATITAQELASLRKLTVDYDGNASSSSASLTLSVYNWWSAAWETVYGPATGVTSDKAVSWSATTSPARYVSSAGEVRFKIRGTRSSGFRTRTDLVRFTIDY